MRRAGLRSREEGGRIRISARGRALLSFRQAGNSAPLIQEAGPRWRDVFGGTGLSFLRALARFISKTNAIDPGRGKRPEADFRLLERVERLVERALERLEPRPHAESCAPWSAAFRVAPALHFSNVEEGQKHEEQGRARKPSHSSDARPDPDRRVLPRPRGGRDVHAQTRAPDLVRRRLPLHSDWN